MGSPLPSNPLGQRTRYVYEGADLREIVDAAGKHYELTHDAQGNLTAVRGPDGSVRRWSYDRLGRALSAIDPLGNAQHFTRDALGRVIRIAEPDGNVRELKYDGEGNLIAFKRPESFGGVELLGHGPTACAA